MIRLLINKTRDFIAIKRDPDVASVPHLRVVMVPQQVVHESGARVPVPPNGHPLVDPVGVDADDVIELIWHATTSGHVRNAAKNNKYTSTNSNVKTWY